MRSGATVIGTTWFIYASWYNYNKEPDFDEWKNRLIIYQCNFLKLDEVNNLISKLKKYEISFIINNACQTIRQSEEYKEKMINLESMLAQNCTYQNRYIDTQNSNIHCHDLITFDDKSYLNICQYNNKLN